MKLTIERIGAAMLAGLFVGTVTGVACARGRAPTAHRIAAAERILVANQQSASASIVELPSGKVTHVQVGTGPHEAAISPDGRWGVISVYGDQGAIGHELAVIDMAGGTVARTIDLGQYTRPHGVAALAGTPFRVVVTSETTQNIVTVDVEKGTVLSAVATGAPGSHMLALSRDGTRGYTANVATGSMSALDLAKGTSRGTLAIAPRAEGIATTSTGDEVWVGSNERGSITVVNGVTMKVDTVLTGFAVPYRMAISPDDEIVVVAEPAGDRVSIVARATRTTLATIPLGGSPRGVTISSDSRTAFVTLGPQGTVVKVDLMRMIAAGSYTVGAAPDGVAFSDAASSNN